jgi:tetratricopeptide (TPR) repeat protein
MKLSRCFSPHQLLFLPALALLLQATAGAQDKIVKTDGTTTDAKVLGVSGTNLQIQVGAGTIGIPLASVSQVIMPPPPEVAAAIAAFEQKDYPKALAAAKSVSDKFKGLPTEWAQQATGMLGDIYLAMNRIPDAEAAYKDFQKAYAGKSSLQSDVGIARIAVAKKDFTSAKAKLQPIAEAALKLKTVPRSDALAYSQTFYLLGQIKESENDYAGALEDYLRTVTLFPNDRVAAAGAQEKADALRKAHSGLAVP